MKLLALFVLAVGAAVVFALTDHGVALVVALVALAFLLVKGFVDGPDDDRLALGAHRFPGGDQ